MELHLNRVSGIVGILHQIILHQGGPCCAWEQIPKAWAENRDLWVSVVEAVGEMARGPGGVWKEEA